MSAEICARENPKLDFGTFVGYRTDRKGVGGRGCWEYTDGKDEFERELRVFPVLAFRVSD